MSDKINKKDKLAKGCLIYKLEIAYNEDKDTIEYVCESVSKESFSGPINASWDYLEEYFDEEDFNMLDSLYEVGEA